jgi:ADP-ribosylglycohydrolase
MTKSSRIQAGIWSSIIGDALGVPVEFKSREEIAKDPVTGFRSHGTYDLPEGFWSDDSSLMLCTIENLAEGRDFETLMAKFEKWLNQGYWTPGGYVFDCGIATSEAISRFSNGETALLCGSIDEYSNGNGSLMRILPFAYHLADSDPDTRRKGIFNASAVTHGHSRSKLACWLYAEVIKNLLEGLGKAESVDSAHSTIEKWVHQNSAVKEWSHFERCTSRIVELPVSGIQSSGYVVHTLEASIYSFLKNDDIWSSLLFSVNLGQDTDTVACVTGGLAGTFYGMDGVDLGWIKRLARWEEIRALIQGFLALRNLSESQLCSK